MELFALIEITKEQPPIGACVVFVPYLGFTQAVRFDDTYQSTITRQCVEPTHWMKPVTFSQVLEEEGNKFANIFINRLPTKEEQ